MTLRALLIVLLSVFATPLFAATEIIPLNYRMAEEMLPMAQSILGNDGKVSAYGNQLIVNAPQGRISELRRVLGELDSPPRRLLISIATNKAARVDESGYAVDGMLSAGGVAVSSGRGEMHGQDSVRILRSSTRDRDGDTQQIQATEGYPALIQLGQSVPLEIATGFGPYGRMYRETEYRDVTRGVYVTARVSGDVVHVTLSSRRAQMNATSSDVIDTQSLDTHVTGHLGEWIDIGGSTEGTRTEESGVLRQRVDTSQGELSMRLKVDIVE